MSKLEQILFIITLAVLVLGGVWVAKGLSSWRAVPATVTPAVSTGSNQLPSPEGYQQAKQAQDPNNPCVPPPGYTEESWRQHMSHHPDEYRQCLGR